MSYPGHGSARQAARPSSQRRRLRAVLTLSALFFLMLGAFLIAIAFNQQWFRDSAPAPNPSAACTPWTAPPKPADITVDVYNSTDRKGLASDVAGALASQQFRIDGSGNDPLNKKVDGVAEVRYGKGNAAQGRVLAQRFPGSTLVENNRPDGIVEVAVGSRFTKVTTPALPTPPANPCR